ncbi:MAG: valine--tRNA ligase [Proteobacteria bacterium]|nr:valine--tRNA ligase [Pseudomonadota bacterium]
MDGLRWNAGIRAGSPGDVSLDCYRSIETRNRETQSGCRGEGVKKEQEIKTWEKVYNPPKVEEKWYQFWEDKSLFRADEGSVRPPFSIVIPPPNITGSLHMGHALNNTLQDVLARYKRMDGFNVLWLPGTDHAGIATQNVVEKQLAEEGTNRHKLGREAFVKRVWKWKQEFGGQIIKQLKKLGSSCDWSRERFTMDEGLSLAVKEVFVRLYREGLIYRGDYIINWCPRCQTALSDLEVEHEQEQGHLYYIKYPLEGSKEYLVVATTRPETMLGDTGVAVHPEDKRYMKFIGENVILPLMNRKIPVIADGYVTQEFGTGALKVTPAHDANDFEIGRRHGLEVIRVIDDAGKMNTQAGRYAGQQRFQCRKEVVKDLKDLNLLKKIENFLHNVGHCYRCKTVIEPMVSKQWFVRAETLARPAIEAVQKRATGIIPPVWESTYFEWMNNIRDWCISRQIWWGHRIPAWYCSDCGEVTVSVQPIDQCATCASSRVEQEQDVLDTWFSSALWPFSTLGWPEKTKDLKVFYPTSVLVTGFDILFFWVARMMMMGIKFMGDVPFKDVYIHALVRDADGQKMSKSRGNVVDPLVVIEKFGTDAFRFTLSAFAAQGRDVRLSEERLAGYRNFANKIWNASRFTLSNLQGYNPHQAPGQMGLTLADRWILSRVNRTIGEVRQGLDSYKFNEAASAIYQFLWHELCDWYIELIKPVLYQENDPEPKWVAQNTLVRVLDIALRLLHPFMPFITEEIWQLLPGSDGSIMVAEFPKVQEGEVQPETEAEMELVMGVIGAIRNLRSELNVPLSKTVEVILYSEKGDALHPLKMNRVYIESLVHTEKISLQSAGEKPKTAATAIVGDIEVFLPLKGLINLDDEERRIIKEISKVEEEMTRTNLKLHNEEFLRKARLEAVEKEKEKARALAEKGAKLKEGLERVQGWKKGI